MKPKAKLLKELLECALLPEDSSLGDDLLVEYLPFELLLPESSEINDIISHLQRGVSQLPHSYREKTIDKTRLTQFKTLEPDKCYVGTEKWGGYILFEFLSKDKIVLECPIEGNATYILTGEWNQMIQHTKNY